MFSRVSLVLGPALFGGAMACAPFTDADINRLVVAGVIAWVATWWFTEAVPIPVTSLLPLLVFSVTPGIDPSDVFAQYADPVVFLFLGGFMLAAALQRWDVHRRAALLVLSVARGPRSLLASIMFVTAVLSAWMSNTAAAMVMIPIAVALIDEARVDDSGTESLAPAMLLGVAYAATLGGLATLIGTPPNAILAGAARELAGIEIGFGRWMLFAMPLSIGLLATTWVVLCFVAFRVPASFATGDTRAYVREQKIQLGSWTTPELRVLALFLVVAIAWVVRPWIDDATAVEITDTTIALVGAILLFVVPSGDASGEPLLTWRTARRIPWGMLLLVGAGLAIATTIDSTGISSEVADQLGGLRGMETVAIVFVIVAGSVLLTEVASNTAAAATLIPVTAATAAAVDQPVLVMMIAGTLGATCGFMMPAGTPPITLAFATGRIRMASMVRAGFLINIASAAAITLGVVTGVPIVFGD